MGSSPRAHAPELVSQRVEDRVRVDGTGDADHRVVSDVKAAVIAGELVAIDRLEVVSGADDGPAQRMVAEAERADQLVRAHGVAVVVEALEDLFADDALLGVDVVEQRLLVHLGEEGQRSGERLDRHGDGHRAMVHVGRSAERSAQALEGVCLIVGRGVALRSAVEHVLEEVTDAVVGDGFVGGARAELGVDHDAMHRGHWHHERAQAAVERALEEAELVELHPSPEPSSWVLVSSSRR